MSKKHFVLFAFLFLAGGCAKSATGVQSSSLITPLSSTYRGCDLFVEDFGATPTPPGQAMIDARPGIQAAIDAAPEYSVVCMGSGRFEVSRAPVGSLDRVASVLINKKHFVFRGTGPGAIIAPTGDAGKGDWRGIDVWNAANVFIESITVDTTGLSNTEEQTHAIQATGPVNGLQLKQVTFIHPRRTTDRVGDCFRLLGNGPVLNPDGSIKTPAALVENVSVTDSTFEICARSGIGVQRGVWGLQVIGSRFLDILKTPIDHEPTSVGGNKDESIVGNHFYDTNATHPGGAALTLSGFDDPIDQVVVADNIFDHRGISTYRVNKIIITGNTITCDPVDSSACLDVANVSTQVNISDNTIQRRAGDGSAAIVGPVVRFIHHGTSPATYRGILHHNIITQDSAIHPIWIESAQDLIIDHNNIVYSPTSTTWNSGVLGIFVRATTFVADGIMFDHNTIRATTPGALTAAIGVATSPLNSGAITVTGNMSFGADQSLRCSNTTTGKFVQPIVYGLNYWNGLGHPITYSCPSTIATLVPQFP